jgi:hypothetical protein
MSAAVNGPGFVGNFLPVKTTPAGLPAMLAQTRLTFVTALQSQAIDLNLLPPNQTFGPIGTIIIDNTLNALPVTITFIDTTFATVVPAGEQITLIAVTAAKRVNFSCAGATNSVCNVVMFNFVLNPTGVQSISGTITAVISGPVTVANPSPYTGALTDVSAAAVPALASTQVLPANANRKYWGIQFPQGSDGWINKSGGVAGPNLTGCMYYAAGTDLWSEEFAASNAMTIYLLQAGTYVVPVVEG